VGQTTGWIFGLLSIVIATGATGLTGSELANEFDRGLKAYDAKQYQAAFQIWWRIKDQDLAAMRNVALMLRKGQGITKNPQKAVGILQIAAATGMPNAEVDLAEMYLNGEADAPSPQRALPLLQEAAAAGQPLGQFLLGQMYEDGNVVPKDVNKAIDLYISSARGGLHEAKERLAAQGVHETAQSEPPLKDSKARQPQNHGEPAVPTREPAVPAVPTAHDPYLGTYVQLGSFKNAEAAEIQWNRLKRAPPLVSLSHEINRADLGQKGVWYRLTVPGGQDRASATALCLQIKQSGEDCLVQNRPTPR
jgi:hypothetical protein